jgi:anti-anti-sigma factor
MGGPVQVDFEVKDDIYILRLSGQIRTGTDADYLYSRIKELRATDSCKVIADFSGLSFLDSTGIAFLMGMYTSPLNRNDGCFVLPPGRATARSEGSIGKETLFGRAAVPTAGGGVGHGLSVAKPLITSSRHDAESSLARFYLSRNHST